MVGVAALLRSAMPNATNSQIAWAMQATAKDLGEKGWDEHHGHGLVHAYDLLKFLLKGGDEVEDLSID
jgi:subtilisin family serine protease